MCACLCVWILYSQAVARYVETPFSYGKYVFIFCGLDVILLTDVDWYQFHYICASHCSDLVLQMSQSSYKANFAITVSFVLCMCIFKMVCCFMPQIVVLFC